MTKLKWLAETRQLLLALESWLGEP